MTTREPESDNAATGFATDLFAGQKVLITGAAGAICGEVALAVASLGAGVVLVDRATDRLERVAESAKRYGARVATVAGDVTDRGVLDRVRVEIDQLGGHVDLLINGVGDHLGSVGRFEATAEQQWTDLYEANLLHVFRFTSMVLPGMRAGRYGRIVNFSSVEGIRAAPDLAVYATFKRAVDGFTRSLAVEVAGHGVLVNSVAVDKTRAYQVDHYHLPPEYQRFVPTWIPAGHYAEPVEVARVVTFLGSRLNTWIVGETVAADGGTLAAGGWYRTPLRWTNQPLLTQYLEPGGLNDVRPPSVQ